MPRPMLREPSQRMARLPFLVAVLSITSGCASLAPDPEDLAPILPSSRSQLETAPPAARDELEEALGWIAEDAPRTKVAEEKGTRSPGVEP